MRRVLGLPIPYIAANKEKVTDMLTCRAVHRDIRAAALAFGLAAVLLGLGLLAAPALAAPQLDVQIESDQPVSHSDERVDYTAVVSNVATPNRNPPLGETLTCNPGNWNGSPALTYQWIRNGAPIAGATAQTYVLSATSTTTPATTEGDAGAAVQCRVTGTNAVGKAVATSIPVTVVEPEPSPAPPAAPDPPANPRPQFDNVSSPAPGETRECKVPTNWTGTGTWTLQWLINGSPADPSHIVETTPTSSKYEFQAEHEGAVYQCEATVEDTNVKAVVLSISRPVKLGGSAPSGFPSNTALPSVDFDALKEGDTSGSVTLEIDLPSGQSTYAHEVNGGGWACNDIPPSGTETARVVCTRSDVLKAGEAWENSESVTVVTALGTDKPDPVVAMATAFGGGSPTPASDEVVVDLTPPIPFGLTNFEASLLDLSGEPYTQAGGHPHSGVATLEFATKRKLVPEPGEETETSGRAVIGHVKDLVTDLPRGQAGNALAIPEFCASTDHVAATDSDPSACPQRSAVGAITLQVPSSNVTQLIYAIEPEFGTPAQFAFYEPIGKNTFAITTRLRPEDGYAISLEVTDSPEIDLLETEVTLCDFGAKVTGINFEGCKEAGEPGSNPKPLFANPTKCAGSPPVVKIRMDSWENPGVFDESQHVTEPITGCDQVDFEPDMKELRPESRQADSSTGLDLELTMPTDGLETQTGIAQANLKRARVTFPEGMSVNPTAGQGLGACSAEQVKLGTNDPISCPDSSKIGSVEIETPVIEDTLEGAVYIAKQGDVDGSLIGFYMVFDSPENGILIKIPAKVTPNPQTGQLVVTVDDSPEAPFSTVRMHFPGGPRATLLTPPKCGTYAIKSELTPWSAADPDNPTAAETVTRESTFNVTSGPGGGPCPSGGLEASFAAGSANPLAGQTSPFNVRLTRPDGSDRFKALDLKMPAGLTAYLKGLPYCPDAILASISGAEGSGQGEIDSPSCPAASQIGRVIAGAGAGPNPLYVDTGRAYLAGPYKGAPLSIAVVAPAVAGPLDLGNVVVRNKININPVTAEIDVISDPIPHILHGLLLDVRDVRVLIDRPAFTLNPSGCEAKQVQADVKGLVETKIAQLANHFQVGGCEALGFKPRVGLRLFGGVKRGKYQGVRAVVRPRPGDSNISRTVVRFPRSAFVAQEHIRTICTRVQWAQDACPKGSIYGRAIAYSPLLDYPLRGNVYLRSSDNTLPDAVADLRGPAHQPIRVEVAVRNDSVKGALRNTVQAVPDAPVSYFRLQLFGGKKGLIVNSRNVCVGKNDAVVAMRGHSGRRSVQRTRVFNPKCRKAKKQGRGKRKGSAHRRRR